MQGKQSAAPAVKRMTIGQLEAEKSSTCWVLNSSSPKGNIAVTVPDGMGHQHSVVVPVTWIPIDMTTQATKQSLLASPVFRRMVTLGMLTVVSEGDATALLDTEEARVEMARVYNLTQEIAVNASTVPAEVASMQQAEAGSVSGFALNIAHTDNLEESQVMNTIKGNESTLSADDMRYIAENSRHPRVKAYMTELLVKKQ